MPDVQGQKYESLQFRQVVVAQLQVEYDGAARFQFDHGLVDVRDVGGLAQYVQPVLFHIAGARRNFAGRWARLLRRFGHGNSHDREFIDAGEP